MRRLLAGLSGIPVVAAGLVWFAQGVAVGEDPGEHDQLSWQARACHMRVRWAESPPSLSTPAGHCLLERLGSVYVSQ
jgi:hypothetical protein